MEDAESALAPEAAPLLPIRHQYLKCRWGLTGTGTGTFGADLAHAIQVPVASDRHRHQNGHLLSDLPGIGTFGAESAPALKVPIGSDQNWHRHRHHLKPTPGTSTSSAGAGTDTGTSGYAWGIDSS